MKLGLFVGYGYDVDGICLNDQTERSCFKPDFTMQGICNPWLCDDGGIPVSSRITGTGGFYSFSTGNQRNPMEQGIDFQIYLTVQSDASVIMCGSKKRRESCLCNGKPGTWKN